MAYNNNYNRNKFQFLNGSIKSSGKGQLVYTIDHFNS